MAYIDIDNIVMSVTWLSCTHMTVTGSNYRQYVDESRFSGILQTNNRQFHFFRPEQVTQPVEKSLEYGKHFICRSFNISEELRICCFSLLRFFLVCIVVNETGNKTLYQLIWTKANRDFKTNIPDLLLKEFLSLASQQRKIIRFNSYHFQLCKTNSIYSIDNNAILRTAVIKDLGVTFDCDFKFKSHI